MGGWQGLTVRVLLVGAGAMGGALLERWVGAGGVGVESVEVAVRDPAMGEKVEALVRAHGLAGDAGEEGVWDVMVAAVKPQQMAAALGEVRGRAKICLSVAAGVRAEQVARMSGCGGVVRCMPNTPAQIGEGCSVLVKYGEVDAKAQEQCAVLMQAVGKVWWMEDEALLDAVTALSGSGPAYVFALTEAMAEAGEALGLPVALARELARWTVVGSGGLLAHAEDVAALRQSVTSPGGTTEAALVELMPALQEVMKRAMQAACERGKELAREA